MEQQQEDFEVLKRWKRRKGEEEDGEAKKGKAKDTLDERSSSFLLQKRLR
jgi:hypothetical protein